MGKKWSWFSAIRRVLTCSARKNLTYGSTKKNAKEKKKGRRILRRGEIKSFLFREPSSIEKILGELDEQNLLVRPPTSEQSGIPSALPVKPTSPRASSPRAASPQTSSYRAASPSATSPRIASPRAAASPRVISPTAASPKATSPTATSLRVISPRAAASPRDVSPKAAASPRVISPRAASPKATSARAASPKASSARAASPKATSARAASPKATSAKAASPKATSARAASPSDTSRATYPEVNRNQELSYANRPEPTLTLHLSATKIQAAYRRHMTKRNFRSLRGLARLKEVVRGGNIKRQTVSAMKQMQFLVRVQMQIKSRRTQMFENQALQSQAYRNDKEVESTLSKWSQLSEAGNHDDWDNSVLTKEEVEARRRGKVEAAIKRERAMTYAYSHQLSKSNPKSAVDIRASGIPWWWNWLEHQLPSGNDSDSQSASKNVLQTPLRAISEYKPSPHRLSHNFRHLHSDFDNHESATPTSTKSAIPLRGTQMHTPRRTSPMSSSSISQFSRRRASAAANSPFNHSYKDDDSLMSCPPFSGPNYMTPTISAKAKFREKSILDEGSSGTPSNTSRRRLTFPLTPNSGSSKWNRGSSKDAASLRDHDSAGDRMSVHSTGSMPAVAGRKPFKV